MASNLPPELLERINRPQRSRFSVGKYETSSGGFVPYTSMAKRSQSLGASSFTVNTTVSHVADTSHWLSRHQVGDPFRTAYMIDDKGNKVWFKFEHTPSLFPVTETRFYKPKLHKTDFLGEKKKDQDSERMI